MSEDMKTKVWNILSDLEDMIGEMKQYMDEIAVEIDDGKKWREE